MCSLVAAAVYYQSVRIFQNNQQYDIASINSNLDWVNLMCYDYHGSWESVTGELATLYDPSSPKLNTDYGVSNWLSSGLHANKLVMGLAFYGDSWVLASLNNTGIGAPATSTGARTQFTYAEIAASNQQNGVTIVKDATSVSMYSYNKNTLVWIGYDSPVTIALKVKYAKGKNALGYFAWALNQDDSKFSMAKSGISSSRSTPFISFFSRCNNSGFPMYLCRSKVLSEFMITPVSTSRVIIDALLSTRWCNRPLS